MVSEYSFLLEYDAVSFGWSLSIDCWRLINRHVKLQATWIVINTALLKSDVNGGTLQFFAEFVINIVTTDDSLMFVMFTSETHLCSYKWWFVVKFPSLKEIKTFEVKQKNTYLFIGVQY